MIDQLLTAKDVLRLTGIKSRSTLWCKSNDENDKFPKPLKDGTHFTRWKSTDIQAWLEYLGVQV